MISENFSTFNVDAYLEKYSSYEDCFYSPEGNYSGEEKFVKNQGEQVKMTAILVDALFTGCRKRWCTFSKYSKEIEGDIKECVELFPEALNDPYIGTNQNAQLLTPFAVACYNEHLPIEIIQFLLQKKADPSINLLLLRKGKWIEVPLLSYLSFNVSKKRYKEIKGLVDKSRDFV